MWTQVGCTKSALMPDLSLPLEHHRRSLGDAHWRSSHAPVLVVIALPDLT
jgi:hypothetical protein